MFYMYGKKSETIAATKNFRHDCGHSAFPVFTRTAHWEGIRFSVGLDGPPFRPLGHDQE